MGRGLSELQRRILLMAAEGHERRKTPNIGHNGVDLNGPGYGAEVYHKQIRETVYGPKLDKKQRAAADAAISRATTRLAKRGLVARLTIGRYRAGVNLTEQGLELTVKKVDK
jgi:hypothetical protein